MLNQAVLSYEGVEEVLLTFLLFVYKCTLFGSKIRVKGKQINFRNSKGKNGIWEKNKMDFILLLC